eukprot:IDg19142t1
MLVAGGQEIASNTVGKDSKSLRCAVNILHHLGDHTAMSRYPLERSDKLEVQMLRPVIVSVQEGGIQ